MPPLDAFFTPRGPRSPIARGATVAAVIAVFVWIGWGAMTGRWSAGHGYGAPLGDTLDRAMDEVFTATGVDRHDLIGEAPRGETQSPGETTAEDGGGRQYTGPARVRVPIPPEANWADMNLDLARAVERAGGEVLDVVEEGRIPESPDSVELLVGRGGELTHRVRLVPESPRRDPGAGAGAPEIAVVFDDLGYTTTGLARELLDIPARLTFAVLPGLPHSRAFAESARAHGHEVILHLPMEPIDTDRHDPGDSALLVDLSADENRARLCAALDGLPFYSGISNHMGSRFTAHAEGMNLVLQEIRARDKRLFFLDSRTTPYSVIIESARGLGVPCLSNNLFLDGGDENRPLPADQTARLLAIARRRGRAVAIGHVRRSTVDAVKKAVAVWQAEGIRLVGVSDLMHRESGGGLRHGAARERGG